MDNKTVQLAHGSGGRLSRDLIKEEILSRFGKGPLAALPDAATVACSGKNIIFTTDSFVVQPIEFPGGNIGELAVYGTVNDLAVSGGKPKYISLAMIVEEGFQLDILRKVLNSVKEAALACKVQVVTGDTKVVPHGMCDGIYMNTAGIAEPIRGFKLGEGKIRNGDCVIVSGTVGEHGMAVMSCRENIGITNGPKSDCAPVSGIVAALAKYAAGIRFMRDPTRGGLSAVLNEVVEDRNIDIELSEKDIPSSAQSRAVAEMLGIDLLYSACEGRVVIFCDPSATAKVLECVKKTPEGRGAAIIGHIARGKGRVIMQTTSGGRRLVDVPRGEILPRIC